MAFQYETVNSADMSTHYHARSLRKTYILSGIAAGTAFLCIIPEGFRQGYEKLMSPARARSRGRDRARGRRRGRDRARGRRRIPGPETVTGKMTERKRERNFISCKILS